MRIFRYIVHEWKIGRFERAARRAQRARDREIRALVNRSR